MKRLFLLSAGTCLGVAFAALAAADPAEPPHFLFVEGLRKRGLHGLALEYLDELQKQTTPPVSEAVKALIPLEIAKTRAEAAARERNNPTRDELFQKAKADLQAFVAQHPNHPLAGQAYFDVGRMLLDLGKRKAAEVRQAGSKEERSAIGKEAIGYFQDAVKTFEEADRRLNARWNGIDPKQRDDKQRALADYLHSLFLHAHAMYELGIVQQRALEQIIEAGTTLASAGDLFAKVANYKDQHALGWEALAWHGRCVQQRDTKRAEPIFKQVLDARSKDADAGKRLVRYFRIVDAWSLGHGETDRTRLREQLQSWLTEFRDYSATPEGQHVRMMLALTNVDELARLTPQERKAPLYQAMFHETHGIFKQLEAEEGEYASVATASKFALLRLSEALRETPVALLATYDECLLRAEIERANALDALARMEKAPPEQQATLKETAASAFDAMIAACQRALQVLPDTPRAEDWEKVHFLLYIGYTQTQEPHRAVVVLEALARSSKTRNDTARRAAITALETYQALYRDNRSAARREADYERLIDLARFMDRKWPTGVETDAARYQLGFYLIRKEGDARAAIQKWEAISPQHPTYPEACYRAGLLYWATHVDAARQAGKPESAESPERDKAVTLLNNSVEAGKTLVGPAGQQAERDGISYVLASLALAEIINRLDRTDEAITLVEPLVARLQAKKLPGELPAGTDGRILGLALRLHVQKKDIPKAIAILESLEKADGNEEELLAVYRQLGDQLRAQITVLEGKNDPAAKKQLEQTRESLRELLASVETRINGKPDAPIGLRLWLGSNYVGLGDHARAAQVFAAVPEPKPGAATAEVDAYTSAQFQKVRCLRLVAEGEKDPVKKGQQLAQAENELKVVVEKLRLQKHPNFVYERILLLQLQEKYSGAEGAIALWDQFRRALEPYRDTNDRSKFYLRDLYHEACFNLVVCKYAEAKMIADPDLRAKAVHDAAALLIPLMKIEALKARFEEYLNHPDRKELKAKLPGS